MEPEDSLPHSYIESQRDALFLKFIWEMGLVSGIHKCPTPVPILSQLDPVHTPHPTTWRSILILSYHLRLGLSSGLFPSGLPTKTIYAPLMSPIRTSCSAQLTLLDFITRTKLGVEHRALCSSLCSFLYSPVTSSVVGTNILLNTLFSNILNLRPSLNVNDQLSHPHKIKGKIVIMCILMFG